METKITLGLILGELYLVCGVIGVAISFALLETWIALLILIAYGISLLVIYAISKDRNKKKDEI